MNTERYRRSIRLPYYNYSRPGAYFVTICAHNHRCLFGKSYEDKVMLNDAGIMIKKWYEALVTRFEGLVCDDFVCMPNHVHFIIFLNQQSQRKIGQAHWPAPTQVSLFDVVHWFKTMTTNGYIKGVKEEGWMRFEKRLWQRNYWERVIRNEAELQKFRSYIGTNPLRWNLDKLNPVNQ